MWGVRIEGLFRLRRKSVPPYNMLSEFVITFYTENRERKGPEFYSTPTLHNAIKQDSSVHNEKIGRIIAAFSPTYEEATYYYDGRLRLPQKQGFAKLFHLKALECLHEEMPAVKRVEVDPNRFVPIEDAIRYLKVRVARERYHHSSLRPTHTREQRKRIRRRINWVLGRQA